MFIGTDASLRTYYHDILQLYENFWDELYGTQNIEAAEKTDEDIDADYSDDRLVVGTLDEGAFLRFDGMQYHPRRPEQKMDICLRFKHTIRGRETDGEFILELEEATTWISYLRRCGGWTDEGKLPVKIRRGYHYDFEFGPNDDHPIFHVQYDPTAVKLRTLRQRYDILNESDIANDQPQFPRIPSAPLDISGVVYQVLKDDVDEENENFNWPSGVCNVLSDFPFFPEACFTAEPQNGSWMYPEWWYGHAEEGEGNHSRDVNERYGES